MKPREELDQALFTQELAIVLDAVRDAYQHALAGRYACAHDRLSHGRWRASKGCEMLIQAKDRAADNEYTAALEAAYTQRLWGRHGR